MVIAVLTTGEEIIRGEILDTNFQYIARILTENGFGVSYHLSCGDKKGFLKDVIKDTIRKCDAVIITGGLGPTEDDITREAVAEALGLSLIFNNRIWQKIKAVLKKRKVKIIKTQKKQAMFPEGARVIANKVGIAPGFYLTSGEKLLFVIPGVPSEAKSMIPEILSVLRKIKKTENYVLKKFAVFGIPETIVEQKFKRIIKDKHIEYGITVDYGMVYVWFKTKNLALANKILKEAENIFGENFVAEGAPRIEETAARLLLDLNKKVAIAESCTGGLIADKLTNVPGISASFMEACVCYSNQSKIQRLGVNPMTIERWGAVSPQVAFEMARGALNKTATDIAVSTTGIAGPTGATPSKPVGLVYICVIARWNLKNNRNFIISKEIFSGDRIAIKRKASDKAIDLLRRALLKCI